MRNVVPLDAAQSARLAGLRYVTERLPGVRRRRAGRGFVYVDAQGRRVRDSETLRRIRALGVTCRGARRVARRAHYKALGLPVPPTGVRRFRWRDWRVTGDLRGDVDRYVAVRGGRSVRWVFS